jgi:hypothetical protein
MNLHQISHDATTPQNALTKHKIKIFEKNKNEGKR